jgi:TPR repeat protein
LGCCFLNGHGTNVNHTKAFKWFQKAAKKGNAEAMFYVGQFYLIGQVVEQSNVHAKYWLEKVLESGEISEEKKLALELLRKYNL